MLTKSLPVKVKAGEQDGLAEGQFEALVSVFGNVDSYGDVIVKGAFADDLERWAASGDPIPVYWSHRMDDPDMNIGHVLDAAEVEATATSPAGLWVRGQLDLETPKASQVYRLMKGRRVTQFSFAYDVLDAGWAKSEELGEYYELRKLKVYEVGPTPVGANQETQLLDVKALERLEQSIRAKAGRVLSAKNEAALRDGLTKIADGVSDVKSVLAALDPEDVEKSTTSNDSKATASEPAKDEDRPGGKSEEPMRRPVDLSALQHIELDAIAASTEV